jgi:hypothetical protein
MVAGVAFDDVERILKPMMPRNGKTSGDRPGLGIGIYISNFTNYL